jgi:hypothetical protein
LRHPLDQLQGVLVDAAQNQAALVGSEREAEAEVGVMGDDEIVGDVERIPMANLDAHSLGATGEFDFCDESAVALMLDLPSDIAFSRKAEQSLWISRSAAFR